MIEMKRTAATSGGESGLRAVPDDKNSREHAEQVLAHGVEEVEVLREQAVDGLKDVLQEIVLHGSGSFDVGFWLIPAYGIRKFWSESVRLPVTWAMLPAAVARRVMSALMALLVASRCCLASTVWTSSREARSLLES